MILVPSGDQDHIGLELLVHREALLARSVHSGTVDLDVDRSSDPHAFTVRDERDARAVGRAERDVSCHSSQSPLL